MCAWPWTTFFFSRRRAFFALGFAMDPLRSLDLGRLLLRLRLLPACDRLLRTLAGARVGMRALAPDRERPAVPDPLVATDLDLPFDVLRDLAPEVSLDLQVLVDVRTDLED